MSISILIHELLYHYPGLEGSFQLGPLTAELPRGKFLFWVGHNGSGKTTLARLLCGEIQPHSGRITELNGSRIHHHQSVAENLFPDLRVVDHFRLLSRPNDDGIDEVRKRFPELEGIVGKYPDELSGGQLQLVAFSTVILEQHGLYIFDEVLNHLDSHLAARVIDWIKEKIVLPDSAACIVITHDLTCVRRYADIVYVFAEGRIVAILDRKDLAEEPDSLLRLALNMQNTSR